LLTPSAAEARSKENILYVMRMEVHRHKFAAKILEMGEIWYS